MSFRTGNPAVVGPWARAATSLRMRPALQMGAGSQQQDSVSFSRRVAPVKPVFGSSAAHGFDAQSLAAMTEIANNTVYGKNIDRLLDKATRFKVFDLKSHLVFENYANGLPQTGCKQGDCVELSWDVGRELKEKFGDQYTFMGAIGNDPTHFILEGDTHHYLLAWPKAQAVDQKIRAQLQGNPHQFPEGALLIDPSFHQTGFPVSDPGLKGYKMKETFELTEAVRPGFNPLLRVPLVDLEDGKQHSMMLPVGFLKDLIPAAAGGRETQMIYLYFDRKSATEHLKPHLVGVILNEGDPYIDKEFESIYHHLPTDHALKRLVAKMTRDIEPTSVKETMRIPAERKRILRALLVSVMGQR